MTPEPEAVPLATGVAPVGDVVVATGEGPQIEASPDAPGRDHASTLGPVAVLTEGLTVATGSSRLLRRASIYIGLLMLALAGPGVVAGLSIIGSEELFDAGATVDEQAASAAARAALLIFMAFVGAGIAAVEGTAIGITLLAGHVLDRPMPLSAALARSRKVFWRIVRAGLVVGAVEFAASHIWQVVTGNAALDDLSGVATDPIPAAIVSLPFLYATVAIVIADDGAQAGLRRSVRIARRHRRLTVALGAFGLLSGVVQGFALGSGLDLIVRVTDTLHLDLASGGPSFLLAATLALAIVMAAGSLLFTVTAIVNAPQIVAWSRLGLPLDGLATAAPEAAIAPEGTVDGQPEAIASAPPELAAPEPVPTAWALAAAAEAPFRWITIPMRLTIAAMWLIAVAALIAGPPG